MSDTPPTTPSGRRKRTFYSVDAQDICTDQGAPIIYPNFEEMKVDARLSLEAAIERLDKLTAEDLGDGGFDPMLDRAWIYTLQIEATRMSAKEWETLEETDVPSTPPEKRRIAEVPNA